MTVIMLMIVMVVMIVSGMVILIEYGEDNGDRDNDGNDDGAREGAAVVLMKAILMVPKCTQKKLLSSWDKKNRFIYE